jgi:succinyl-diaminopimelate desuccinylase
MVEELTKEEADQVIRLTKDLIQIPSTLQDGDEVYRFAHKYLKDNGLNARFQEIKNPYVDYQKLSNLYLRLGNGDGPKVMINGHLDTVVAGEGWYHSPFDAHEEDGRIYGLGAADMKGGCAAAIMAVIAFMNRREEPSGELLLSCVFGEEAPFSLGADTLLREFDLEGYNLVIITEPSTLLAINDYCLVHKKLHKRPRFPVAIVGAEGRVLFEVELFGRSSHASHPSQGINALHDAAHIVSKLQDFDLYSNIKMGRGHYVVLKIEGGDDSFTVPHYAKVSINRQLTLGETEESVLRELRRVIRSLHLRSQVKISKRFSPEPSLEYTPYLFENDPMITQFIEKLPKPKRGKRCKMTSSSVGDFNIFATRTGVPTLVFGPGGGDIHSPNEYVNRDEVVQTTGYLLNFFLDTF